MKKFLFILVSIFAMAACVPEMDFDEVEATEKSGMSTRSTAEAERDDGWARVRIAMFETIPGYTVKVANVRVWSDDGDVPVFGNHLEGAVLGTSSYDPTYDTENGGYTLVETCTEVKLYITFDAEIVSERGQGVVTVKGASAELSSEPVILYSGDGNETTFKVKVSAESLDLKAISFDATVEGSKSSDAEADI